jgi:hypothetical protein
LLDPVRLLALALALLTLALLLALLALTLLALLTLLTLLAVLLPWLLRLAAARAHLLLEAFAELALLVGEFLALLGSPCPRFGFLGLRR